MTTSIETAFDLDEWEKRISDSGGNSGNDGGDDNDGGNHHWREDGEPERPNPSMREGAAFGGAVIGMPVGAGMVALVSEVIMPAKNIISIRSGKPVVEQGNVNFQKGVELGAFLSSVVVFAVVGALLARKIQNMGK